MDPEERKRLEAAGYRIYDDAADWLGLTAEEREEVELRLALSRAICRRRDEQGLNRRQLAARLKTSQSQAAKIEDGSAYVSLDLLFRTLFALGGRLTDLGLTLPAVPARKRPGKGKAATRSKPRKRLAKS